MAGVPDEIGLSAIDTLISCEGNKLVDGAGKPLTDDQLCEVAAVYNAWRVGNLQDCTIREVPSRVDLLERHDN